MKTEINAEKDFPAEGISFTFCYMRIYTRFVIQYWLSPKAEISVGINILVCYKRIKPKI